MAQRAKKKFETARAPNKLPTPALDCHVLFEQHLWNGDISFKKTHFVFIRNTSTLFITKFLTIFSRPAKDLGRRLSLSGPREGGHPDAVVGEGVQAVQLQELPLRLLRHQATRRFWNDVMNYSFCWTQSRTFFSPSPFFLSLL